MWSMRKGLFFKIRLVQMWSYSFTTPLLKNAKQPLNQRLLSSNWPKWAWIISHPRSTRSRLKTWPQPLNSLSGGHFPFSMNWSCWGWMEAEARFLFWFQTFYLGILSMQTFIGLEAVVQTQYKLWWQPQTFIKQNPTKLSWFSENFVVLWGRGLQSNESLCA